MGRVIQSINFIIIGALFAMVTLENRLIKECETVGIHKPALGNKAISCVIINKE